MNFHWSFFIDLGLVSIALLVATFLRVKIGLFRRFLVPNSLTAGFLLFTFYNTLGPVLGLSTANLENMVFHLLGLSFVAMSLRQREPGVNTGDREVFRVSLVLLIQHIFQAVAGLLITYLLIKTVMPDLFPGFGFFLPLGFALGPGQALAFGSKWEAAGFAGAPSVGITFATIGFLLACFGGMVIINVARRKGIVNADDIRDFSGKDGSGLYRQNLPPGMNLTTNSDAIDTLTINAALVLLCYFLTYGLLTGLTHLLATAGNAGIQFADSLWVITYVFAGLVAMLLKMILRKTKANVVLDNGALTRISGFSVDFLVAGSLAVVSISVVRQYWLPILIISIAGILISVFLHFWISSRIFKHHVFGRSIIIYGAMTGTLPTGLALLRVIDPDFRTRVASDHMYAAGLMFPLAIPFILIVDFPVNWLRTGNPLWLYLMIGVLALYVVFCIGMYIGLAKKQALASPAKIWYTNPEKGTENG